MTTTPETPTAPAPNKHVGTQYIVLEQDTGTDHWILVATVNATSADNAIKQVATSVTNSQFVAVPKRSWRPVKVTVQSKPVFKLEDA